MARKRDPVAEYIAAHPDRVHQGRPAPEKPETAAGGARKKIGPKGIVGWCSVTRRPVVAAGDEPDVHAHARREHPDVPGCRIEVRLVEVAGRMVVVAPEWAADSSPPAPGDATKT
jgi:hypothetical protein